MLFLASSSAHLQEFHVSQSSSTGDGGAAFLNRSTLVAQNCSWTELQAGGDGGAIYALASLLHLTDVSLSHSSAVRGGGIALNSDGSGSNSTQLSLLGAQLEYLQAAQQGGALWLFNASTVVDQGFLRNCSSSDGAALWAADGNLTLNSWSVMNNEGESNGALALAGLTAAISHCTFSGNKAPRGSGGAIFAQATSRDMHLALYNCTLTNNTAQVDRGRGWGGGFAIALLVAHGRIHFPC